MSPIISAKGGLSSAGYGQFFLIGSTTSFDSIATYTIGSGGQSTVTFGSIPSTYKHLQIRALARGGNSDVQSTLRIQFNSDTTSSYSYHRLQGDGSSASASGGASFTYNYLYFGVSGANAGSNIFGANVIDILDYALTTKNKTVRFLGGIDNNGSGGVGLGSGGWYKTDAITSISLSVDGGSNFAQYTQFALYGIKG